MTDEHDTPTKPGVFIVKGMTLTLRNLGFRLHRDGSVEANQIDTETGIDVTPVWLRLALRHVLESRHARDQLKNAVHKEEKESIATALFDELESGMQAVICSAIAMEAYAACIQNRIEIPNGMKQAWRDNRTAKHRRIAEILRRAFPLSAEKSKYIRTALHDIFSNWRDEAIHPSTGTNPIAVHETLNQATDRKFAKFRHYNARECARLVFEVIRWTSETGPKKKHSELKAYCEQLTEFLEPLNQRWINDFGDIHASPTP